MEERLRRLRRLIAEAGRSLNPVLSEGEVAAFEGRNSVTLPEEYRRFLLEVGNGGEGPPHYGLVPLGQGPDSANREQVRYWEQLPHVHLAFPFTVPWNWDEEESTGEGEPEQARHGSIFLGEDGCGMNWHLIVSGAERGRVWVLYDAGVAPTVPTRDFLAWYEDWLAGVRDWFTEPDAAPDRDRG